MIILNITGNATPNPVYKTSMQEFPMQLVFYSLFSLIKWNIMIVAKLDIKPLLLSSLATVMIFPLN